MTFLSFLDHPEVRLLTRTATTPSLHPGVPTAQQHQQPNSRAVVNRAAPHLPHYQSQDAQQQQLQQHHTAENGAKISLGNGAKIAAFENRAKISISPVTAARGSVVSGALDRRRGGGGGVQGGRTSGVQGGVGTSRVQGGGKPGVSDYMLSGTSTANAATSSIRLNNMMF